MTSLTSMELRTRHIYQGVISVCIPSPYDSLKFQTLKLNHLTNILTCNTRAPQVHHTPSKQLFTVPIKPARTFNITLTEPLSTQSIRGPLDKPFLLLIPNQSSAPTEYNSIQLLSLNSPLYSFLSNLLTGFHVKFHLSNEL